MKILALAVASVVVVQLPASAGGVPVALAKGLVRPFASGVMAPLAAYLASERDAASAVMARQADLLVHAGVPRPAVLAEAATARDDATVTSGSSTTVAVVAAPAGLLEPAGDVNRDGVKDVLESRYDGTGPSTLTLYARDGKRAGSCGPGRSPSRRTTSTSRCRSPPAWPPPQESWSWTSP